MTVQRLKSDLRNDEVVTRGPIRCLFNILPTPATRPHNGHTRATLMHALTNKTLDKQTDVTNIHTNNQINWDREDFL